MKEREELISDLNDELFTYDKDFTNEDVYALFEKYVNNKAALRKVITFGMFHYEYVGNSLSFARHQKRIPGLTTWNPLLLFY